MVRTRRPPSGEEIDARTAGLRYVHDAEPGLTRVRHGQGFWYRDAQGRRVDQAARERIRKLAIPPAWTDVWIAADARAHLQATGRDARGRKQYRYHPQWTSVRDGNKYDRVRAFARVLPAIRARVRQDLSAKALSRPWLLATIVRLLEMSVARVGNDEYRRANGSYGLTTLLEKHAQVEGATVTLRFRAKSGVHQVITVHDPALARRVRRCQDLPGQTLFQYVDDEGELRRVGSADVNAYLQDIAGDAFTAKDFRTWAGTLAAAKSLDGPEARAASTAAARNHAIIAAIDDVAKRLGNTRAVCRKCYVHPAVIDRYVAGVTLSTVSTDPSPTASEGLGSDEQALLALLERPAARKHCA